MLERIARTCYRRRGRVLIAWIVTVFVVMGVANAVQADYRADMTLPDSETKDVQDLLEEASPNRAGFQAQIVYRAEQGVEDPAVRADEARLQEVLRLRKENFETHGADTRDGRQLVPGRSWAAWSRALGLLLPPLSVADLGCGEGYLTIEAARWASRVVAVDRSDVVLDRARDLARRRRVTNVAWKRGELEKLPMKDADVDVALLSQALHHANNPARAVAEAARVTVPGGRVLILDLREHQEEWVRSKLGDRSLGFRESQLRRLLADAGLRDLRVSVGARKSGDPFAVLIAAGTKPVKPRRTEGED